MNHKSLQANRVEISPIKTGEFVIFKGAGDSGMYIQFVCPCGNCKGHDTLPISADEKVANSSSHCWHWNGDMDKPTLKPSLQRTSECKWHGFLTGGVFVPCR